MNVIEAKIYLLLAPGKHRVRGQWGEYWVADQYGRFLYGSEETEERVSADMWKHGPFTKVEPERSNLQIAEEIVEEYESTESRFREILNAVDDKIRRAKL